MSEYNRVGSATERTAFVGLDHHQSCVEVCVLDAAGQ
jgi:hypothetical protein